MQEQSGTVHTVSGEYREIAAPEKLAFSWRWQRHIDFPDTLVTEDFRSVGNSTEVTLTYELLPNE